MKICDICGKEGRDVYEGESWDILFDACPPCMKEIGIIREQEIKKTKQFSKENFRDRFEAFKTSKKATICANTEMK